MKRLAIALTLFACGTETPRQPPGTDPTLEPTASPARASQRGADDFAGYVGVVTPRSSAEVLAPFTTTVAEVIVKLGDRVEKGQKLARLDDRPLREELAIAQATLNATRAEAAQAEIEHRATRSVLDRERRAYEQDVTSMAQVNAAEFNERKAEMAVVRSVASVEEQRARIAKLKARLVDTTLVAPVAGKIALSHVQAGERVEEGQPVVRVISSDELFVKFAIPADKAGTLSPGSVVDVVLEPRGTKTRAVVRHVAPELDPIAQMIVADADLIDPPAQLQSGMVCRIIPQDVRTKAAAR